MFSPEILHFLILHLWNWLLPSLREVTPLNFERPNLSVLPRVRESLLTCFWENIFKRGIKIHPSSGPCLTSLGVHCVGICLPVEGKQVRALVWEDSTCRRATKPSSHRYRACEPPLLKPTHLDCALKQETPPQRDACTLQLERTHTKQRIQGSQK